MSRAGVNITIEEANISVAENETREVCVVAIQKDFTRTIPVQIMYTDGTAIGNGHFYDTIVYHNAWRSHKYTTRFSWDPMKVLRKMHEKTGGFRKQFS